MVGKPTLFCDRGEIGTHALLASLVLVERDVEAEPAVTFEPAMTALHPALREIEVFRIRALVVVGIVLDVHVVRR